MAQALKNLINIDIDIEDFETKVIEKSFIQPVLVDFWAEWCSPCLVLAPILKQVAKEFENELFITKLEVDEGENMKLAGQYQVRGFPTVIMFKDGKEADRFSSSQTFNFIQQFIRPYL
ncbi:MAG: thioredoxin fold domain-containing protein [Gammaproteobacteria bacterium]|nr:thioredoxin fold domain-containing protein [Gammaproteobacteria bacterium]